MFDLKPLMTTRAPGAELGQVVVEQGRGHRRLASVLGPASLGLLSLSSPLPVSARVKVKVSAPGPVIVWQPGPPLQAVNEASADVCQSLQSSLHCSALSAHCVIASFTGDPSAL